MFKASTLTELCDALVLPAPGRKPLVVLAGFGNALRPDYSLADPAPFELGVRVKNGQREYVVDKIDFRVFPKEAVVSVPLAGATIYALNTPNLDHFRVFLVCREDKYIAEFEAQLTSMAFEAATVSQDWRLENALDWCNSERRVEAGELQPETGIKMPEKLRWRLRKPVFRADEHRVLYQWELCSLIDGPYERPLITCVTDNEGIVARMADLLPVRLMFAKMAPASAAVVASQPQPPQAAARAPAAAPPAAAAATAAAEAARRPTITKPPEKVVPAYRKQALEDRMRAAGEAEMAKIRKLFEMPD